MLKLLVVFAASLFLAYVSDRNTRAVRAAGHHDSLRGDWAYIALVVLLTLFSGLRTSYNDTVNYVAGFNKAPEIREWLSDPNNLNPFKNPLFYFFQSVIKSWFNDAQVLIFVTSFITQACFIRFFKRYSENFLFSIFIYFTLGTFVLTISAIKQVLGMAIVTLAFPYLEKKKWLQYYLLVFIAALIHTYAFSFAVLPFFRVRPWRFFTYAFVAVMVVVMMNFEEVITEFMEQANDLGKTIAEYEVFDDNTVNIFRLGVYAVVPLLSLIFQRWVLRRTSPMENTLIHMSIISLAFMSMGTQSGANMFGRMGNYFELGTVCCLPKMLRDIFQKDSHRLIVGIAVGCFLGFFWYANAVNVDFGTEYQSISLWQFLFS